MQYRYNVCVHHLKQLKQVIHLFRLSKEIDLITNQLVKNSIFEQNRFSMITSEFEKTALILTPSCLPRQCASNRVRDDLKRSKSKFDLRSRSCGDLSQVSYESMHLDEPKTMRPFTSLYLFHIASYRQKPIGVTPGDLK